MAQFGAPPAAAALAPAPPAPATDALAPPRPPPDDAFMRSFGVGRLYEVR